MINKKNDFDEFAQSVAEIGKAISHPARVNILKILAEQPDCICGDIVNLIPLAQSTVSQHLKRLKDAGLIKGEIDGPKICYCIDYEKIEKFKSDINSIFVKLDNSKEVLCC
jgi:ArsR family transcriptional regulator